MAESSQLMPLINTGTVTSEVEQMINPVQPFEILCLYHMVIMVIR